MVQEGGCKCGALRFRVAGEPMRVIACHCTTCKRRTGAAYGVGVYVGDEQVTFNAGERATHEFRSDESGRWLRNEFCTRCGTTVSWTLELRPGLRGMAAGCFDDPDWFDVDAHIWTRSARKDMQYPPGIPTYERALT